MALKTFQTRRSWHNSQLVLLLIPPTTLVMVLVFAISGKLMPVLIFGGVVMVALAVSLLRDTSNRSQYRLHNGRMVLENSAERMEADVREISDASLIDRAAARAYIRAKLRGQGFTGRDFRERMDLFTRFCSVDIGITSFTLGLGRSLIDRMPDARWDLVLLRFKNGEDLLLSPQYNQDLVEAVNRLSHGAQ